MVVKIGLGIDIPEGSEVLVDSNPIIYTLEDSPLAEQFRELFEAIDGGQIGAVVTPITVAEVVTGPLKARKDALAERYRRALTDNPGWRVRTIDADLAMLAARMRVRYKLKLPDALQLAAAVSEGCHALVTHDRVFSSVTELPIVGTS